MRQAWFDPTVNKNDSKHYDAIVVGSGIGGLTTAGLLCVAGYSVLVLEQHDRPGGYAHGFRRKRYHFDSAVHLISGCGPDGYDGGQIIHKTLSCLGVRKDIDFIRVDPLAVAAYPGFCATVPQTSRAFLQAMRVRFPSEFENLKKFITLCLDIARQASAGDEILFRSASRGELPVLLKYRRSTLAEVCGEYIRDSKLIAILTANWPYLGLPPSRVSFVYWSTMFIGYLEDGACYCRGGFQRLADTLVDGLKRHGGNIRFKSRVDRICVQNNQVRGVVLRDGRKYSASRVVANADMHGTVYELIGRENFPKRFLDRMERLKSSLSIFAVYLATDLDLTKFTLRHESFCYANFDHEKNYADSCAGKVTWIGISIPSLTDSTLCPAGQHLILLTTLVPFEIDASWKKAKTAYISEMLDIAERHLPGLGKHLLYVEGGSPKTMERYTGNHRGAAYGWDLSPDQVGPSRIANRSPIEGLFFAGHWTTPGGGVYGAAVSGVHTTKQILNISNFCEFWSRLESKSHCTTTGIDTQYVLRS